MNDIQNIALIEDDDVFVFLATKTIQQTNRVNSISVFSNGLDALNFFKENKKNAEALPEIILLDLSMPIMDGWQFLEEYTRLSHEIKKKIALYICSSSISPDDIARAKMNSRVSDYLIKPPTKEKLAAMIENYYQPDRA